MRTLSIIGIVVSLLGIFISLLVYFNIAKAQEGMRNLGDDFSGNIQEKLYSLDDHLDLIKEPLNPSMMGFFVFFLLFSIIVNRKS